MRKESWLATVAVDKPRQYFWITIGMSVTLGFIFGLIFHGVSIWWYLLAGVLAAIVSDGYEYWAKKNRREALRKR